MPGLSILYDSAPPGAVDATSVTAVGVRPFSGILPLGIYSLNRNNYVPKCATFEDDYWTLGEDFKLFPDDSPDIAWPVFSTQLCASDGEFSTPIELTFSLSGLFSAADFSIYFDKYGPTWCAEFDVAWYRDGNLLLSQTQRPTSWMHTFHAVVENFNKIIFTFKKMSAGYRFLKIQSFSYGTTVLLDSEDISGTDLFTEADIISDTIPVSTFDFKLRCREDTDYMLQRKQFIKLKHGSTTLGEFYISGAKKTRDKYSIQSVDAFGLLDMMGRHMGGIYDGVMASEILSDIIGGSIAFFLDESLDVPLYGYLPIADRRENLRQVVFALGAGAYTDNSRDIYIRPVSDDVGNVFDNSRTYDGGSLSSDTKVSEVRLYAYSYKLETEPTTLFEGPAIGAQQIEFSEPMGSLSITGGSIIYSSANFAIIIGESASVVLQGKAYKATQRVYSKENPWRNVNDVDNVATFEGMTLISSHNAERVLESCLNYAMRNKKIETKVLLSDEKPGDYVQIHTEDGAQIGHILSMDYTISNKLAADVVILVGSEEGTS